jgi:uncharacterized membrane protein YbhN (UPF0104 family)
MDIPWPLHLLGGAMQNPERKLVTPFSLAVDAVLVIAFFVYMYGVTSTHVPSRDHRMVVFWGVVTSSCLAAVFWLALQMFRVVAKAQREGPGE